MVLDGANVCGILIVFFGTISFAVNSFMIILFVSYGLISWKNNNAVVYRLIFNFLITDAVQLTPTIYIGLCATLQRSLLSVNLDIAVGTLNLWMWYQMLLMLMIMAINRVIGVCYLHGYDTIFTARNVYAIIFLTWTISATIAGVGQFLTPCCPMIASFQIFTFLYYNPNNEVNYSTKYPLPLTEICIVVLIVSYGKIVIRLHKKAQEIAASMSQAGQRNRARQNVRFAIQYVFISLFFVLMYIFYKILPVIVPAGVLLPYSSIAFCMVANCSIHSVMYLLFNPEISRSVKQLLHCKRWISPFESETTVRRIEINTTRLNQ